MAVFSAVPPPPQLGGAESSHQSHDNPHNPPPDGSHATPAAVGHQTSLSANANGIDIEAWTVSALQSLSISPVARGTGSPLSIPLDESGGQKEKEKAKAKEGPSVSIFDPRARSGAITPPPRPSSRRDSLKRREALLKGNEGSRQRRRWENGKRTTSPFSHSPLRALSVLGGASARLWLV